MRGLANLSLGITLDLLTGHLAGKSATPILSGIRETRRTVQAGQQIGERREVLDRVLPGATATATVDPLLEEEQRLTEELERVRSRRVAGAN
jgi:hypothetical protein